MMSFSILTTGLEELMTCQKRSSSPNMPQVQQLAAGITYQMTDANQALELDLKEGQITRIPKTDITIEVRRVRDFTSEGCLGGPIGCRDYVELEVTQGKESKGIILYFANTRFQREQGINKANIFGYKILLIALQGKQVTLSIEENK
jgi:hypothetical protein